MGGQFVWTSAWLHLSQESVCKLCVSQACHFPGSLQEEAQVLSFLCLSIRMLIHEQHSADVKIVSMFYSVLPRTETVNTHTIQKMRNLGPQLVLQCFTGLVPTTGVNTIQNSHLNQRTLEFKAIAKT